jgi:FtsP/CotA-like multicopper oxidase with cupredoxin domain
VWAVNGVVAAGHHPDPLLELRLGGSYRLRFENDTAFPHPIHLHGHAFQLLSQGGKPAPRQPWLDTVLLGPREDAEVAFVADNPGKWMLHCHIPEHQDAGMMAVVEVG